MWFSCLSRCVCVWYLKISCWKTPCLRRFDLPSQRGWREGRDCPSSCLGMFTHTYMHARTHACTHIHTYRQTDRQTDTHIHTHTHTHTMGPLFEEPPDSQTVKRVLHGQCKSTLHVIHFFALDMHPQDVRDWALLADMNHLPLVTDRSQRRAWLTSLHIVDLAPYTPAPPHPASLKFGRMNRETLCARQMWFAAWKDGKQPSRTNCVIASHKTSVASHPRGEVNRQAETGLLNEQDVCPQGEIQGLFSPGQTATEQLCRVFLSREKDLRWPRVILLQ